MAIATIRIADFRNLEAVDLSPCPYGINIICGNNGSGKTSLLEAIHYLGSGRSFRSSTAARLIRYSQDKFSIFSQLLSESGPLLPIGIERETSGSVRMRLAEKDAASIAEMAALLPIRVINSQSHHLFESGPIYRRKFLDWGLFYHSERFFTCWRHFERVMKHRNALLRDRRPMRELAPWTEELVKYGMMLDDLRRDYIQALTPIVVSLAHELLGTENLAISYDQGWPEGVDYAAALTSSYADEMRMGYTQYGPHRADMDIMMNAVSVKHFLSRGQQKLLICAMILAQGIVFAEHANKPLIYLVDDLPSELDFQGRKKLVSLLAKQQTQVFITAIESDELCELITNKFKIPMKVFHVEHGRVTESPIELKIPVKLAGSDH